jgi:hypothetical protein
MHAPAFTEIFGTSLVSCSPKMRFGMLGMVTSDCVSEDAVARRCALRTPGLLLCLRWLGRTSSSRVIVNGKQSAQWLRNLAGGTATVLCTYECLHPANISC